MEPYYTTVSTVDNIIYVYNKPIITQKFKFKIVSITDKEWSFETFLN